MSIKIDKEKAFELLQSAYNESLKITKINKNTDIFTDMEQVLLGSHLTYRYILFTGILAKSLNRKINPLCLQASASIDGAYDARSLCHDVIIKKGFERDFLKNNLGKSNEPYLNKPARYPMHSTENPVRGGNDKKLQEITFNILNYINDLDEKRSYDILCIAIFILINKKNIELKLNHDACSDYSHIINQILDLNTNGESCACSVGAALMLLSSNMKWNVKIHPVNQAGSSSNEILDIDIYKEKKPFLAIEVKDKSYTESDIRHASRKCLENNVNCMSFITGNKGIYEGKEDINTIISELAKSGCIISFISAKDLITNYLAISGNDFGAFINNLNECLNITRSKDSTKESISLILS